MQLVSRKVLFDVMSHRRDITFKDVKINEIDDSVDKSAFQTFMKKASTVYDNATNEYDNDVIAMSQFSNDMYYFLKENKDNIRFVGEGSSRDVYALANGTALKLAKTKAGLAQNKQEAKNCMDPKYKYEIFPDFYAADTKDWLALNCELCAKAKMTDFAKMFKAQPQVIMNVIEFIIKMKLGNWELNKARDHYRNLNSYVYAYFIQQLIDNKTLATKAIYSLIDFYRRNSLDELLMGDLESVENWGLTIRDNQQVLVVIDAGFNEDVWQNFYKKDKKSYEQYT